MAKWLQTFAFHGSFWSGGRTLSLMQRGASVSTKPDKNKPRGIDMVMQEMKRYALHTHPTCMPLKWDVSLVCKN